MGLTNYGKEMMGYKRHIPPVTITCRLMLLKLYTIDGVQFEEAAEAQYGNAFPNVQFGIGSSVNAICQLLIGDDYFADEAAELSDRKAQGPFLLTVTSMPAPISKVCEWSQEIDGRLHTLDVFNDEKQELELTATEREVPVVLGLAARLTKPDRIVRMRHILSDKLTRTLDNQWVSDRRVSASARASVIQQRTSIECWDMLQPAVTSAPALGERVTRLMYSAMQERDNMKAFLFSWMALEVLVSKKFAAINVREFPPEDSVPTAWQVEVEGLFRNQHRGREIHKPAQKFAYMAIYVWSSLDVNDLAEFKRLKKVRDDFAHGEPVEHQKLPTEATMELLSNIVCQL
ncbi:hypothetical protein [Pseudoduganella sp. OTU4001]|uniref:hypothetical protein n=1 Tax=Pseudoduganella sp. OTU4001 TaxID=3043854 RepID=UPI00313A7CB5